MQGQEQAMQSDNDGGGSGVFHLGFMVILDSGFCVLNAIVELCKKGVFASALIKK